MTVRLELEAAREARNRVLRRRLLVVLVVLALIAGGVYLFGVRPAQERQERHDQRVRAYYCDMTTEYGSPAYYRCLDD